MAARTLGAAVGAFAAVGVIGAGLYWFLSRPRGGGSGWGLGGGGGGDSLLGTKPPSGPSETEGTGGKAAEPGADEGADEKDDPGQKGSAGATGNDSKKPSSDGSAGGSGGAGGGTGSGGTTGGGGKGGGGIGGGEGGGVGSGKGSGTSGNEADEDDGGVKGEEGGGGASDGPYDPWGGEVIGVDLPAPDLTPAKLSAVRETVEDLVLGAILDPGVSVPTLPGPLHVFNPESGGLLLFWADVALHHNYSLPHGRLDPDNATHVAWINLWLDILAYVGTVESKVNNGVELLASAGRSVGLGGDPLRRLLLM